MGDEVSFLAAKKIPPAFAGILVDWKIGTNEITSTLVDLIVKGNLGVSGEKIFVLNKNCKFDFEKKFISLIFKDKKDLSFSELSGIAYDKVSNELEKIICDGMIKEEIITKDFQEKMANNVKGIMQKVIPKKILDNAKLNAKSSINEKTKVHTLSPLISRLISAFFIILFLFFSWKALTLPSDYMSKSMYGFFAVILFIYILIFSYIIISIKFNSRKFNDMILSDKGKKVYNDMINLKKFMKKYPMIEDRLANELVAHSIAFGIGKKWMKKLGKNDQAKLRLIENVQLKNPFYYNFINFNTYVKQVYS